MANFLGNILNGIGGAAQGVGNWIGQGSQQFSPAVQNFANQAGKALSQIPQPGGGTIGQDAQMVQGAAQDIGAIPGMAAGLFKQGGNYFNPTANNGQNNFWQTPEAQQLGGAQQTIDNIAQLRVNWAQPASQGAENLFGGPQSPVGQVAGMGAGMLAGIPESILNVPSDIAQSGTDIGTDIRNGQFSGTRALGDVAEAALPIATIWTMGEGPSLLKGIIGDSWKTSVLKGFINGAPIGGAFGLASGLEQNKDASNFGTQFEKSLPSVVTGMLGGGILGSVLGPGGKFFFGGKPGDAAALATHGMVPPETMNDAFKILNVPDTASLADVRSAYTNAVNEFHPQAGGTNEAMQVLNSAYSMATRNVAPSVSFDESGTPQIQFSNEFGGNLTPQQTIAARKAAAQNTAFQARIENLKAGGLGEKASDTGSAMTPDQFLEHGSDLISPEGQAEVGSKVQQAKTNQPAFQDVLDTVAQLQQGRAFSNLKDPYSAIGKVVDHRIAGNTNYSLGDVNDFLRGTVQIKDKGQLTSTVDDLKSELAQRGYQVLNETNHFADPQNGYEGYHMDIKMPDGQVGEIQIHTPQSLANAHFTHGIYAKYDEAIPSDANEVFQKLQDQIKQSPSKNADVAARAYGNQQVAQGKFLSPMESDYSGDSENERLALQMVQRGEDPSAALDNPHLTDQEMGQMQLQKANPQLEYPEFQTQHLQDLVKMREGLQTQLTTEPKNTSAVNHLIQLRDDTQQQINQAQSILKNYDLHQQRYGDIAPKTAIRSQITDLRAQFKSVDSQVKDAQLKLKQASDEQNVRIKAQLTDLNKQIGDEQSRVKVAQTLSQEPAQVPSELPAENTASQSTPPVATSPQEASSATLKHTPPAAEQSRVRVGNQQTFTGQTLTDYDPNGVLSPKAQQIVRQLLQPTDDYYGEGRDVSKTREAHVDIAMKDVEHLHDELLKTLPDKQSRSNVLYALDNSVDPRTLTPQEKNVYDQMNIIHQVTYDVAKASGHNDLQAITHYAPSFATSIDSKSPYFQKQALSTSGPQVIHRDIRAFMPADGTGQAQIGTKERLGLTESGKSTNLFEDANGNQFVARDATMKEKEGLGIRYDTDLASAEAKHLRNVLAAKENFGVRQAVTGDKYAALRSNPGQPRPAGFRSVNIPELSQYGFEKGLANGLNQTVPRDLGQGIGNDMLHLYQKMEGTTIKASLLSPVGHPPNILGQALFANSVKNPVTGVPRLFFHLGKALVDTTKPGYDESTEYRQFKQLGSNIDSETGTPSYLKDPNQNVLQSASGALDTVQKTATAGTWKFDTAVKVASYRNLIGQGMDPREAVSVVDRIVGDYKNINPGFERAVQQNATTFYPWLKTEMQPYILAKKYPLGLVGGLAWSLAGIAAIDTMYQKITGNPDAKLGVIGGTGKLTLDAAQQLNPQALQQDYAAGKLPPLVYSHIGKPILRGAAQQLLNHNLLTGKQIANPNDTQTAQLLARGSAGLGELNPAGAQVEAASQGKKSLPEAISNQFLSSTPHLTGFQAAPNLGSAQLKFLPNQVAGMTVNQFNTAGAKSGTGMGIIHAQDAFNNSLTSQQQTAYANIKNLEAQGGAQSYQQINQAYANDPKLFGKVAQMKVVEAQANGVPVDPQYDPKNKAVAQDYLKYSTMNAADQAKYLTSNPSVLEVARQQDAWNQNPQVQQYKQQLAKQYGNTYKPYVANPLYASDPQTGQPKFSNDDIAAYRVYQNMPSNSLSDSGTKLAYLANHPQIMQAQIQNEPYQQHQLQSEWDTRPQGQTIGDFLYQHQTANIAGVDQSGKIIPKYSLMDEPKYQLAAANPQAGTIYNVYKAAMANKDYGKADPLVAKYPWITQVDQAQKAYTQAHPFNSETSNQLGGLGIDFSGKTTSGSGGSSSSGSNYMNNYLEKQFMYGALKDAVGKFPIMQAGQTTKNYAQFAKDIQQLQLKPINQSVSPAGKGVPLPPTSTQKAPMPKIRMPKVSSGEGQIKFKTSSSFPQETVQAGQMQKIKL